MKDRKGTLLRKTLISACAATTLAFTASAALAAAAAPAAPATPATPAVGTQQPNPPKAETRQSLMVTPEWLKANIGKVVLIDARASSLYKGQQGHLPGAVNAEWTYFANMGGAAGHPKWGSVVDSATMAKKLGALGIDGKKQVVVYGDGGDWGNAAWVVWILRMSGFKNAQFLDGGFTAWRSSGGKTSNTTHVNKAVTFPSKPYNTSYIVGNEWMAEHYKDENIRIVDVRSEKEYAGEIRPFGEKRPGHIPGAVNFPMSRVFTPDYKIVPQEELVAMLEEAGFNDKHQPIILYDTAGVRSSFMTMIFLMAGYADARNYNPSYQAWCGNPDLEITQGPNP